MTRANTIFALLLATLMAEAQPKFSKPHGLYSDRSITVAIEGTDVHYTLDGSTPTAASQLYTEPLHLEQSTVVRAVEVIGDSLSPVATATYIFTSSVLAQPDNPKGYPDTWGEYTQIWGTAIADYGMDPEMTGNRQLAQKIVNGLSDLPILSIVTDRDNLFSHEPDEETGGIYIFTGPPVGDATGHGWTRPASIELIGGPQKHDLSTTCGLRLHGGHGRLAEKNPKHSFRLVFKEKYGPKTLQYPVFGDDEPSKFDQLVVRCHFGNAWQHWSESNRTKAQYSRDVWARRMQRRISGLGVNALYVHLFLNGMYWGLYNMAERVDEQFGKDHLGGKKSDIDVVKIEEDGGNHIEAAEGTLDAWEQMVETATRAATDESAYQQLDTLLNVDAFIDYMLINQYGGNTDWDHHNWYAIRRRGEDSQGFRFLCWDTEIIFESARENVLSKNNGNAFPTGIFQNLLRNDDFARRYLRRAKELLAKDGLLGEQSVVEVWDSLYNTISGAIYAEAARWGDYRRDVHQWQSRGQLYTVDNHYMAERQRLLTEYFPVRTDNVLGYIMNYVDIDDFEAPDDWTKFTASMFHEWNGTGANAQPTATTVNTEWNLNNNVNGGGTVAGFSSVSYKLFADVSQYDKLVLRGTGSGLRILANRLTDHGPYKQIIVSFNSSDPYWDTALQAVVLPLADLKTAPTNEGRARNDSFVHINAMKVNSGSNANVTAAYLVPSAETLDVAGVRSKSADGKFYNLSGQLVDRPSKGIYIVNGRKVVVR
ncbi:MAG: CotH kinase family protein [Prevotella sp.]|nr:CotH kinase family protein [Prevotella sp.]